MSTVKVPSLDDSSGDPVISDDGRTVIFESYSPSLVESDTNEYPDLFVFSVTTAPWL